MISLDELDFLIEMNLFFWTFSIAFSHAYKYLHLQVSVLADDILKNVEYDALRIVFNKFHSVVSFVPTVSTVLSPEVSMTKIFQLDSYLFILLFQCCSISLWFFIWWYVHIDCWKGSWIWGKAWWSRFIWSWGWWDKGRNASKSGRVSVLLCKSCYLKQKSSFLVILHESHTMKAWTMNYWI